MADEGATRRGAASAPTLETVAALAGVSRATVSRVVNGDARVAPDLRAAVEDAVRQLDFVPNRAARTLASRRSDSVALIMREPADFGVVDPYLSSMVIALSHALSDHGLQLVVMMAGTRDDPAPVANYVRSHVDGVLLISVHDDDQLPQQLARAGVPIVTGGRFRDAVDGVSTVDVDNVGGAALAAGHLLGLGRSRIAMISGPQDTVSGTDRAEGFTEALREAGVRSDLVAVGDWTSSAGERAMGELLERAPDLDAVFAASDLMAIGALHALRSCGRTVPGDVAVVGFDDIALAQHASPPLTTVRQPAAIQAQRMVDLLLERLAGAAPQAQVVLPVSLVVRDSA